MIEKNKNKLHVAALDGLDNEKDILGGFL